MIARLTGALLAKGDSHVIVEVGGIGFKLYVPASLLDRAGHLGTAITLHTHLHVRENELTLYGCATEEELSLFLLLLGVSGIGPKMALNALSIFSTEQLRAAIAQGDALALARISGIGRRTAERLILDLRDKVGLPGESAVVTSLSAADTEVIAALTSLGFSVSEAQAALRAACGGEDPVEEKIRLALRHLAGE